MRSVSDLDDAVRTMIRRARLTADADDAEFQQRTDLAGLSGDQPGRVHRFQQPGISHVPVKGAEGFLLSLGGRSDRAVFFGGETEGKRPTGYAPGDTVLYDNHGNVCSLVKAKMRIVHSDLTEIAVGSALIRLKKDGTVEINP